MSKGAERLLVLLMANAQLRASPRGEGRLRSKALAV